MSASAATLRALLLAATLPWMAGAAAGDDAGAGDRHTPDAAVCQEAMVSPVSGFAECVKPRGAPVAPAPPRPDAPPDPVPGSTAPETSPPAP